MVITFVQKRKTQKYLILVLGIVVLAIILVFAFGFLKEEEIFISEPVVSKYLPPIKIDFQVLENPIFQRLSEPFPDLPSAFPSGEVGRENPFLPYEEKISEE